MALIENLQRENLNAIEEALGYAQLVSQFQLTQELVATKVGKSRAVDCVTASIPQTSETVIRLDELLARCESIKEAMDKLVSVWSPAATIPAGGSPSQPRILVLEDCE